MRVNRDQFPYFLPESSINLDWNRRQKDFDGSYRIGFFETANGPIEVRVVKMVPSDPMWNLALSLFQENRLREGPEGTLSFTV